MVEARHRLDGSQQRWAGIFDAWRRNDALRAAGPPLLFGLRLWASVCLALYVAFWLELDNPFGPAPPLRSCVSHILVLRCARGGFA